MAGYASNRPQPPALYTIQTTTTSLHGLDYAGEASHIAAISFGEPPKESLRRWKLEGDSRIVEGGAEKQGGKGYLCMHTSLGGEHVTGPHAVDYVDRRARGPSSPPMSRPQMPKRAVAGVFRRLKLSLTPDSSRLFYFFSGAVWGGNLCLCPGVGVGERSEFGEAPF